MLENADERRRRKLTELCDRFGIDIVAARSGLSLGALDQIIKRVLIAPKKDGTRSPRNLGNYAANRIEAAFNLPPGWFDAAEDQPLSRDAMALARLYDDLSGADKVRLNRMVAALFGPPEEPVAPVPDLGGLSGFSDL